MDAELRQLVLAPLNFSSGTTPELLLKTFAQYCEVAKTPKGAPLKKLRLTKEPPKKPQPPKEPPKGLVQTPKKPQGPAHAPRFLQSLLIGRFNISGRSRSSPVALAFMLL